MEATTATTATATAKTRIYKSFHGWTGETQTTDAGEGWSITTMKRANGYISSSATRVTFGSKLMTYDFSSKTINLLKEKATATEAKIKELHTKALLIFEEHPERIEEDEKIQTTPKIEIGQRVFLDGYGKGQNDGNQIIYSIDSTDWGTNYKTVDLDTLELSTVQHLRPYSEKFGIGTYYNEGDIFNGSIDDLNAIVEKAKQAKQKAQEDAKNERILQDAIRAEKIAKGKEAVKIPEWAKAVIVADEYAFNGDSMTDYFSTTILKTVVLGFSASTVNNMNELKKYALNFEETANYSEEGEKYENKNESGSYGPAYYFGPNGWNGWKVNKRGKYDGFNLETEEGKNMVYLAFTEGNYFVKEEDPTTAEKPNFEAVKVPAGEIQIIDYSEKSFAVIGETKPIKDDLKQLGGSFNFRLSCGAGWIFKKSDLEKVKEYLTQKAA